MRLTNAEGPLFRAVVTVTVPAHGDRPEWTYTHHAGPYTTSAPARNAISREKRDRRRLSFFEHQRGYPEPVVTGYVEVVREPAWERVE